MSLSKPFYRITRPLLDGYHQNIENFYVTHEQYASDRTRLIRAYELLAESLVRIFDYIEPTDDNLSTYSHRTYELILRASTEFETNCKAILDANSYFKKPECLNIRDYYKINNAAHLHEYQVRLNIWSPEPKIFTPFSDWDKGDTLSWYKDYNSVKHDRNKNFKTANLENSLNAISAVFVILFAQFSYLAFDSWHNTEATQGREDGFDAVPKSLFAIKVPNNWDDSERYAFDWSILKNTPDPFNKYTF